MSGKTRRFSERFFTVSIGWLFADLLFVVAMLFLVSNTLGVPAKPTVAVIPPAPKPTISPTPTFTPTPTTNALILDRNRVRLTLIVNQPDALSQGNAQALDQLAQDIRQQMTQKGLQDRRAGLAIAYGGAPGDGSVQEALNIAGKAYTVLDTLGNQHFIFCNTVHYDELFTLGSSLNSLIIDIYLFEPSMGKC